MREIGKRPSGTLTIGDIAGSGLSLHRDGESLVIDFEPTSADNVQAVVDAERQCCSTIGWQFEPGPGTRLRITALPLQLETLEKMFSPSASAST